MVNGMFLAVFVELVKLPVSALHAASRHIENNWMDMYSYHTKNFYIVSLFLSFLVLHSPVLLAQKIVESNAQEAGFRIASDDAQELDTLAPVISYQQHIHMLSAVNDRPSLKIFGNGLVQVHYPAYMKKAGDYEMQFDDAELIALIRSLSANGIMDFDDKKIKEKIVQNKKALKAKGEYYAVSDAVESIIDIKLDEYQKNNRSQKIQNFKKQFKWENIEHDAARYKNESALSKANKSIMHLNDLMKDARLIKKDGR